MANPPGVTYLENASKRSIQLSTANSGVTIIFVEFWGDVGERDDIN